MSNTMMLSKKYSPDKVSYPCYASPKLDGVPVVIGVFDGQVKSISRQGKEIFSLDHILNNFQWINKHVKMKNFFFVGECYLHSLPFKTISGDVRRKTVAAPHIEIHFFDCYSKVDKLNYQDRMGYLTDAIIQCKSEFIKEIKRVKVSSECELKNTITGFIEDGYEGGMIRNISENYNIGKRSWGMMKFKIDNTLDLRVTNISEAYTLSGTPKGMIGSLQALYKGHEVNIGAGSLSHSERRNILEFPEKYIGKIMEIKCMPDSSYDKLRQPVFVRWRLDKEEESYE